MIDINFDIDSDICLTNTEIYDNVRIHLKLTNNEKEFIKWYNKTHSNRPDYINEYNNYKELFEYLYKYYIHYKHIWYPDYIIFKLV
jgi:hypothetical protein